MNDLDEFSDRPFDDPTERRHHRRAVRHVENWESTFKLVRLVIVAIALSAGFMWSSREWLSPIMKWLLGWVGLS